MVPRRLGWLRPWDMTMFGDDIDFVHPGLKATPFKVFEQAPGAAF